MMILNIIIMVLWVIISIIQTYVHGIKVMWVLWLATLMIIIANINIIMLT